MAGTGLWLVGARGSVATTAVVGLLALRARLVEPIGCVTERAEFAGVSLPGWEDIVVGGHDVVHTPLEKRAEQLADAGLIPHRVLAATATGLRAVDARIRDGYHPATHTGAQADAVARLVADITTFRTSHGLDRVVVVNVSSTEPPVPFVDAHGDLALLELALADPARAVLPPSSLMAYVALRAGCAFVDFTPSPGVRLPALHELAVESGLPYAGSDGKTGETLLRTVLAPMFTARALRVRSWAGTNLLGGGDGANLADPVQARGKLESKARGLTALLGEGVTAPLHIDNVPDLGEQKTAWDHVSFEGFLGARMSLQLTWTGLDSALAAPLILDLTRLTSAANASGLVGPLPELAFFFKDPVGTDEHRFAQQTDMLTTWANNLSPLPPSDALPSDAQPSAGLPSSAQPSGGALPSDALASDALASSPLPSRAQPSNVQPSSVQPSGALPSSAQPSNGLRSSGAQRDNPQPASNPQLTGNNPALSGDAGRLARRDAPGNGWGLPSGGRDLGHEQAGRFS